ncbi:uncharacterized protein SPAPADRAFT_58237 [Spathaspora passalidarum NRRL Y-27907]|uniref:Uncharacterized protein n=1 Tax=Spathaspora passalidarum (strain NRRL Y-27907 / 11-Y1) TaxID=619300 RepID=G3AFV6_SPAPN|nr:uncharacterized protein SPAPADRAFT_58237 [Spathaspora passalidarum NRRL Y-27907]EGW35095.1 hypothetical protein SPAPADRAFT_58237 [Spathaspora passalidarum NRRL Y-27907]
MDQFYINNYIKFVWIILCHRKSTANTEFNSFKSFQAFNNKYGKFIQQLIINSQLSSTNLMISLYYLYKYYHHNHILDFQFDEDVEESSMIVYLVITSLILSNKSFDDQSYTLKTWLIIINNTKNHVIKVDLKLLNYLEGYFLCCLDFKLSFVDMHNDDQFWKVFTSSATIFKVNNTIIGKFKSLVEVSTTEPTASCSCDESVISSTFSSPLLSSIMSPSTTINYSSPLSYTPLTPLTPYEYTGKRRKLLPNVHQKQPIALPSSSTMLPVPSSLQFPTVMMAPMSTLPPPVMMPMMVPSLPSQAMIAPALPSQNVQSSYYTNTPMYW